MKILEFTYEHLFPTGKFENERIGIRVSVDETENIFEVFKDGKATVFQLHDEGKLLEESKKVAEAETSKPEIKPAMDKNTKVGEYNPEKIPWVRAEGEKGIYERFPAYQQKPAMLTDYINLLEDLKCHSGKLQRAGLFYWKFPDGSTIGRKPAKKK